MKFNLDNVVGEYTSLEAELTDPSIFTDPARLKKVMRRKKSLERTVELYSEYKKVYSNLEEAKFLLSTEKDPEMILMAKDQLAESEARIPVLEETLKIELLPKDLNDDKNIILEVRAGAGGDEAALFGRELCNAYINFAREQGFGVEILDENA
jgi:peptide chain release factor 1